MPLLYPQLQVQPTSGLDFPWADALPGGKTLEDASFGHGGVSLGKVIYVYWYDLINPTIGMLGKLIGYSSRTIFSGKPFLFRQLPWRHPQYTQLWCTRISKVEGVRFSGKETAPPIGTGPISKYQIVALTLQFSRPNYNVLSNEAIANNLSGGYFPEWLRFVDRHWTPLVQMISREGMQFIFRDGPAGSPRGKAFPGSVGQKILKLSFQRTWYQLPEQCIFDTNGFPCRLLLGCDAGVDYSQVDPIAGTVNLYSFLGNDTGTLLYSSIEIKPVELPLPQQLMGLVGGESFPVQYDVTFHLDWFNPRIGASTRIRGHNCMPWSGDSRFYAATATAGNFNISATANTTPIRITLTAPHTFSTGDIVYVNGSGVAGAEGAWVILNTGAATIDLVNSVAAGAGGATGTVVGGPAAFNYKDFRVLFQVI